MIERFRLMEEAGDGGAGSGGAGGMGGDGAGGAGAGGDTGGAGGAQGAQAGGFSSEDWRAALPEELRSAPGLKDVRDVASLAKQFVDQQAYLGTSIRVPSEEAGEKDWEAFFEKVEARTGGRLMRKTALDDPEQRERILDAMGRPKEPTEYEVPEAAAPLLNDEMIGQYRAAAHKAGLTKEQFQQFLEDAAKPQLQAQEAQLQEHQQAWNQLQAELGAAFTPRQARVLRVMEEAGFSKELIGLAREGRLAVGEWRALDRIGEMLGKEGTQIVTQDGTKEALTPDEARARADEIYRQMQELEPGSPEYNRLMQKRVEYFKMANASGNAA